MYSEYCSPSPSLGYTRIYLLGLLSELSLLMDDPKQALYLGPPVLRAGHPPNGPHVRVVESHMNMPIVITLILSVILFILLLWFFLSPSFLRKDRSTSSLPQPIDLEDLYFVDENVKHYNQRPRNALVCDPDQLDDTLSPPPAYASRPNSSAQESLPFFHKSSTADPRSKSRTAS
ncbi:hypothetical protein BDZ97DRAFT_75887 [Flammula alnicola]|nr:hypothetical protein BDZ97DRAFT_75887 [Flammula alnicola]